MSFPSQGTVMVAWASWGSERKKCRRPEGDKGRGSEVWVRGGTGEQQERHKEERKEVNRRAGPFSAAAKAIKGSLVSPGTADDPDKEDKDFGRTSSHLPNQCFLTARALLPTRT